MNSHPAATASQNPIQSSEETDHLVRSTKKIKNVHENLFSEIMEEERLSGAAALSIEMVRETPQIDISEVEKTISEPFLSQPLVSQPGDKAKSFKAALLEEQTQEENARRLNEFEDSDEENDDMDSEDSVSQTKSKIKISFSKDHLKRIRSNWKGCLIIKLLGRSIGFKALMDKIHKLWNLEGRITPMDVGLGFYIIRFESKTDYHKVYTGGPWIIQDHYLTVQKWYSDFRADKAQAIKTAVWIRFSLLPAEYYDEETLTMIAAKLGKPMKVDNKTIKSVRGSYARICIEMDLSQPLEPSIAVGKFDYSLEYEHIHTICFSCGRVGHRREGCSLSSVPEKADRGISETVGGDRGADKQQVNFNGQISLDGPEEIGLGEWMVVSRRKKGNRPGGPQHTAAQTSGNNNTQRPVEILEGALRGQSSVPQGRNHTFAKNNNSKAQAHPRNNPTNKISPGTKNQTQAGPSKPREPQRKETQLEASTGPVDSQNFELPQKPKVNPPLGDAIVTNAQSSQPLGNQDQNPAHIAAQSEENINATVVRYPSISDNPKLNATSTQNPEPLPSPPPQIHIDLNFDLPQTLKKPPDVNPHTKTFHECARLAELHHRQGKGDARYVPRDRSRSPCAMRLVDGRDKAKGKAERGQPGGRQEESVGSETDSDASVESAEA